MITQQEEITLMMTLSRTHREWFKHMRKCALEVGIPDSYRMIIMYLSCNPGATQKMLADFSNKTTAAVNQTVKEMLADGYLRKETDPNDQRYTRLFLTRDGERKAAQLRERLHQSDRAITAALTPQKEAEMIEALNLLFDTIRRDL